MNEFVSPPFHVRTGAARPHGKQVGHHGAEPRRQAGLGDEPELKLGLNMLALNFSID